MHRGTSDTKMKLITGASVVGAVFAVGATSSNLLTAEPQAVASGMRTTFLVAAVLVLVALAIALVGQTLSRPVLSTSHGEPLSS